MSVQQTWWYAMKVPAMPSISTSAWSVTAMEVHFANGPLLLPRLPCVGLELLGAPRRRVHRARGNRIRPRRGRAQLRRMIACIACIRELPAGRR